MLPQALIAQALNRERLKWRESQNYNKPIPAIEKSSMTFVQIFADTPCYGRVNLRVINIIDICRALRDSQNVQSWTKSFARSLHRNRRLCLVQQAQFL